MIICGDARRIPLADESVQCVVTSPPYWGLRKYDGEQELVWETGNGESGIGCAHEWQIRTRRIKNENGLENSTLTGGRGISTQGGGSVRPAIGICVNCGAWRGAYGLEPTIEMYVAHSIEILREIRRVLRKDGVCFWNLGDTYSSGDKNGAWNRSDKKASVRSNFPGAPNRFPQLGVKPKDLCLIPERVALAAQGFASVSAREIVRMADILGEARRAGDWAGVALVEGILRTWTTWSALDSYWVRSLIIWAKPNPMPENVTDRPTDAYEHILMLTKSAEYFWDAEAVAEPSVINDIRRPYTSEGAWQMDGRPPEQRHGGKPRSGATAFRGQGHFRDGAKGPANRNGRDMKEVAAGHTRNLRNVWTFPTQPYSGAHFATFPEELPRRCIKAATSAKGACAKCGAPWERVVHTTRRFVSGSGRAGNPPAGKYEDEEQAESGDYDIRMGPVVESQTLGWRPGCDCGGFEPRVEDMNRRMHRTQLRIHRLETAHHPGTLFSPKVDHRMEIKSLRRKLNWLNDELIRRLEKRFSHWPERVPCLVLDPFAGSGTTGRVALELGRRALLVDLAYAHGEGAGPYAKLAEKRIGNVERLLGL